MFKSSKKFSNTKGGYSLLKLFTKAKEALIFEDEIIKPIIKDNIKLFGSTINNAYHSHVQTYIFSLDKEALTYLIEIDRFSITKYLRSARDAQNNEILISKDITDKGWNIGCLLKCYHGFDFTFKNKSKKDYGDKLHTDIMYEKYRNVLWNEYEVVFIKGNRIKVTS